MDLDASALIPTVLDQLQRRLAEASPSFDGGIAAAEPLEVVADRIAGFLVSLFDRDGGGEGRPSRHELERLCCELAARNRVVASSLGACACWGEDASCAFCGGRGAPGWRRPERQAFRALVAPVLRKMSRRALT